MVGGGAAGGCRFPAAAGKKPLKPRTQSGPVDSKTFRQSQPEQKEKKHPPPGGQACIQEVLWGVEMGGKQEVVHLLLQVHHLEVLKAAAAGPQGQEI